MPDCCHSGRKNAEHPAVIDSQPGRGRHRGPLALDLILERLINIVGEQPIQRRQGLLVQALPLANVSHVSLFAPWEADAASSHRRR